MTGEDEASCVRRQAARTGETCDSESAVFTPRSLEGFEYYASPEVMRQVFEVECEMAKLDQRVYFFRYKTVLNDILATLDALASARIAGIRTGFLDVYREESCQALSEGEAAFPEPLGEQAFLINKVLAFKRCLFKVREAMPPGANVSEDFILSLYDALNGRHGADEPGERIGYRASLLPEALDPESGRVLYAPPAPDEIPALMARLISFCNSEYSGAFVQTVVAHLTFESIAPFDYHMDHMGRLLCQMVFFRRGLFQHMICPIALLAAEQPDLHASILFPYRNKTVRFDGDVQRMITRFLDVGTRGVVLGLGISKAVMRYIQKAEDIWEKRLGKVRPDSAHRAILRALPAMPEFSVPYAMLRTGRSRSAVNAALHDLERAGIIRQMGDSYRNRSFEAPVFKVLFNRLEDVVLSGDVPSREAVSSIDTGIDSVLRV